MRQIALCDEKRNGAARAFITKYGAIGTVRFNKLPAWLYADGITAFVQCPALTLIVAGIHLAIKHRDDCLSPCADEHIEHRTANADGGRWGANFIGAGWHAAGGKPERAPGRFQNQAAGGTGKYSTVECERGIGIHCQLRSVAQLELPVTAASGTHTLFVENRISA